MVGMHQQKHAMHELLSGELAQLDTERYGAVQARLLRFRNRSKPAQNALSKQKAILSPSALSLLCRELVTHQSISPFRLQAR
jgi:hypothetical protein